MNPKNMCDGANIWSPVIHFCIILNIGHKEYNQATNEDLGVN